jgi:hypothetical protein
MRLKSESLLREAYFTAREVARAKKLLEKVVSMRLCTSHSEEAARLRSAECLAWAYIHKGSVEQAIELLEEAIES